MQHVLTAQLQTYITMLAGVQTYVLKLAKSGSDGEKVFLLLESGTRFHTVQVRRSNCGQHTHQHSSSVGCHTRAAANWPWKLFIGLAPPPLYLAWQLLQGSCSRPPHPPAPSSSYDQHIHPRLSAQCSYGCTLIWSSTPCRHSYTPPPQTHTQKSSWVSSGPPSGDV